MEHTSFWSTETWKYLVNNGVALLFSVFLGYIVLKYLPILSKIQLLMIQLLEVNKVTNDVIKENSDTIKECAIVIKDNCEVMRDVRGKL